MPTTFPASRLEDWADSLILDGSAGEDWADSPILDSSAGEDWSDSLILDSSAGEDWADSPILDSSAEEDWSDSIILRSSGGSDQGSAPEFTLLEGRGPNPAAFLFACVLLSASLFLGSILIQPPLARPNHRDEIFTEITLPPLPPEVAENSPPPPAPEIQPAARQPEQPDPPAADTPSDDPLLPGPTIDADPRTPAPAPLPQPMSAPLPARPLPEPPKAATLPPAAAPAPAPQPKPEIAQLPGNGTASAALKLLPAPAAPARLAAAAAPKPLPEALGTLPLASLLQNQAALAAQLAALPPDQRLALPQVWIRVNAEWFEALAQTHERLYFSLTSPGEASEVLGYLPASRSFTLEHPQRPLWQIRDGDQVPALAALRAAAARQLGSPASLVGVYTWHPPVMESALRMFVFDRMRQLGARLGPQDVVTVRLASGPGGYVMNLEPLRRR